VAAVVHVDVRLTGIHLHCHLCGDETHLAMPPGVTDLQQFITGPGGTWMTCHRDPHLYAVELSVNGEPSVMRAI
jgi:hypothetical protein